MVAKDAAIFGNHRRLAPHRPQPHTGSVNVLHFGVNADEVAPQPVRRHRRSAGTYKRIQNGL